MVSKKKSHHRYSHRPNRTPQLKKIWNGAQIALLVLALTPATVITQEAVAYVDPDSFYHYIGCYTERTDLLKESVYSKIPQACIEICERQTYRYAILSATHCYCTNNINEQERQDEQLCNTRCLADKSQYCGGAGVHSYYSTLMANVGSAPAHFKVANATENSLLVTWAAYEPMKIYLENDNFNGKQQNISNFLIRIEVIQSYSSLPFFPQPEFVVQNTENRFEITDLHPATSYNVTIEAVCGQTVCGSDSLIGVTAVGVPSPVPMQPKITERTATTVTIQIPPIKNDNGPVTKVLVIVERVDDSLSQSFDTQSLGSWQKAQDDGLPYYIAAELDYDLPGDANKSRMFTIGDGKRYGKYFNAPLGDAKADIHVSLGVISTLNGLTKTLFTTSTHDQHSITMENFSYATFETGKESIIALTVTCVIFATCLAISLIAYFYLRYKTHHHTRLTAGSHRLRNTHEMTLQQPIIERENNGFIVEDEVALSTENVRKQLNNLLDSLPPSKRIPRNALRMNVNDVLADGCYGEVISGSLIHLPPTSEVSNECQLHVLSLDELSHEAQIKLLKEFSNLTHLQSHDHILDFYGVSASADWIYFIFEHQTVTLKRRLIESRRAPNTLTIQRITALSEELVLQWIYEIANAMEYLANNKVVHKQLCSHYIYVTADSKIKLQLFGPISFVNNQKKVDLARWLAPETLRYQQYTTKSDIWSFACVAWECCTLGATPYPNITNSQELLTAIKGGARPAQPSFVFHDLYQLFLNCWQLEPNERTNFEDITFNVRQLMTSPRHALSFDRAPEPHDSNILDTLPYYLPMHELCN